MDAALLRAKAEAAYEEYRRRISQLDERAAFDLPSPQKKQQWIGEFLFLAERGDVEDWEPEIKTVTVPSPGASCPLRWNTFKAEDLAGLRTDERKTSPKRQREKVAN